MENPCKRRRGGRSSWERRCCRKSPPRECRNSTRAHAVTTGNGSDPKRVAELAPRQTRTAAAMSRQQCRLIGFLAVLALPALAEEVATLESVTVTAQKFEQGLQDVPLAITAIDRQELQRNRITTVGEVLGSVPSITIAPYVNSTNTPFLYMRGIGFNDPGQISTDGAVGLYQDGFYISRPQGIDFDLSDIQRIEVLRGPQGTLYGRNTMGGAFNLISRAPSGLPGFRQELEMGNERYYRALSVFDMPAWNSVSAKLSLLARSIDGSIANPEQAKGFGAESQQ